MASFARRTALADLLGRLADERGQLDTPADEAEIARYLRLLGEHWRIARRTPGRLMRLVLDTEAVNALLDPKHSAERKVRQAVEAARRLRRDDSDDLGRLAASYRTVVIESLAQMLTAPGRLTW